MKKIKSMPGIIMIILALFSTSFGQQDVFEREIIVMFKPGIVTLPAGLQNAPLPDVVFTANGIALGENQALKARVDGLER